MSPTSAEVIPNRALSGSELRELLVRDFTRALDAEGLLSAHLAYGRVSYTVGFRLHLDNPNRPTGGVDISSRIPAANDRSPAPTEAPPLASPSADAVVGGMELSRSVTSPNAERLREGLPVRTDVRQQDGSVRSEYITYPATGEDGDIQVKDAEAGARAEWRMPPAQVEQA